MKKLSLTTLAIIALSLFISCCSSTKTGNNNGHEKGKYFLQFNPTVGKQGKLVISVNLSIEMEVLGEPNNTSQAITMATDYKILSNSSKEIKSAIQYDYFAISMNVPNMDKMEYDSRKNDNEGMLTDAMADVVGELMNNEIYIVQDHSGKTIRTEGLETITSFQQGKGGFNMNSLMNFSQFPLKPISIGDIWTKKIEDANSPLAYDVQLTLQKVSDGKVYIDLVSDVSTNPNYSGSDVTQLATGKQTGTLVYDEKTMWFIEGVIQQNLEMTINQLEMSLPMKIKGEINLKME